MLSQHQPGFTFTPDRLEFELTQLLHFWFSAGTLSAAVAVRSLGTQYHL